MTFIKEVNTSLMDVLILSDIYTYVYIIYHTWKKRPVSWQLVAVVKWQKQRKAAKNDVKIQDYIYIYIYILF